MRLERWPLSASWSLTQCSCPSGTRPCTRLLIRWAAMTPPSPWILQPLLRRRGDASFWQWPFLHHVCRREGCGFVLIPGLGSVKLCPMREGSPSWRIQPLPPSLPTGTRVHIPNKNMGTGLSVPEFGSQFCHFLLGDPSVPSMLVLNMRTTRVPDSQGLCNNWLS